jgi:UDP-N-acetylmuramoylalanine--D-glutamate ligase
MKIGVLGGGESGIGAALLAKEKGHVVLVSDSGIIADNYKKELKENNIRFEESRHNFEILESLDLIVKSPGIPNSSKVIEHLRTSGVRVIGEIEFGYLHCSGKIVAITGTNGKTTTTNLTYDMFKNQFENVAKGGNIGNSFCRLVIEDLYDWYVLEVSSFQLEDIIQFKPDISCILNVTPDHLDRYSGSIDEYRKAKARITINQKSNDVLFLPNDKKLIEATRSSESIKEVITEKNITPMANPYLKGKHNAMNVAFARGMSLAAGVAESSIRKAIDSFVNDEHRLQPVARINEVTYVNDSKATNVDAVYYALTAFSEPIIWIAGGVDKGNDYSKIENEVIANVKGIVVLGEDDQIKKYFKNKNEIIKKARSMKKAIKKATKMAEGGDVVLLSPACASFDLFDNYKDRGEQFIQEVWNLID